MCHMGFSVAGGARVGNLIGAGEPDRAKKTVAALMGVVLAIATAIAALLLRHADLWVAFYTMDPAVAALATQTMPLVAFYICCDAIGSGALNKLLANLATVRVPALVNLVAFYGVGLPYGPTRPSNSTKATATAASSTPGRLDAGMASWSSARHLPRCCVDLRRASDRAKDLASAAPTPDTREFERVATCDDDTKDDAPASDDDDDEEVGAGIKMSVISRAMVAGHADDGDDSDDEYDDDDDEGDGELALRRSAFEGARASSFPAVDVA